MEGFAKLNSAFFRDRLCRPARFAPFGPHFWFSRFRGHPNVAFFFYRFFLHIFFLCPLIRKAKYVFFSPICFFGGRNFSPKFILPFVGKSPRVFLQGGYWSNSLGPLVTQRSVTMETVSFFLHRRRIVVVSRDRPSNPWRSPSVCRWDNISLFRQLKWNTPFSILAVHFSQTEPPIARARSVA